MSNSDEFVADTRVLCICVKLLRCFSGGVCRAFVSFIYGATASDLWESCRGLYAANPIYLDMVEFVTNFLNLNVWKYIVIPLFARHPKGRCALYRVGGTARGAKGTGG